MKRRLLAATFRLATGVRRLPAAPHGDGPAIYFANHTSNLDFVVIWSALPAEIRSQTSPAAAEDYWRRNALRRWLAKSVFQAVLIPREGVNRSNNPIDSLSAELARGRSIMIFPEGTRRMDGEIGPFRSGIFHLARRHPSIPLVPVHLDNLNRILPKGTFLPVPLIARADFLPPIFFRETEPKAEFLVRARQTLLDAVVHHAD